MTVKFEVKQDASVWMKGTRRYTAHVRNTVGEVLNEREADITQWMKENAPWRDRTGRARASLHAVVTPALGAYIMSVMYGDGIYYRLYLEYAQGGRFAIVAPTVDYWAPILIRDIAERLRNG